MSWQPAKIDTSGPPLRLIAAHRRPGHPWSSFIYLVYRKKRLSQVHEWTIYWRRTLKMASCDRRINFSLLVGNINSLCIYLYMLIFWVEKWWQSLYEDFYVTCINWISLKRSDVHVNTLEEFRPFESLLFVRLFNLDIFKNTQYLIFVLFFIFNFQYDKSSVNFSPHLFISFTECNT